MGTQGSGRKRLPTRERLSAEDDALNQIAREAEARLAAKRAARAEAREIRMKELERQQKEIYQVQKKYYGLDTKWGDIERWMEDSERHSRRSRRSTSASDEDERLSVGSRGSLRSQPDLEYGGPYTWTNGYDGELYGSQSLSRRSGRNSSFGGDGRVSTLSSSREEKLVPLFDEISLSGTRRGSACGSRPPSEYSGHLNSGSRASSRASSARASPVVEERPEKDFAEKGSRNMPGLSAATLASLGGTSSRRGSGDTSISIDTEASIREIKELNELKDQIQDVEGKYMQGLKEMKDSLAEVEEKYKKAMVSNAQLDNEKTNFMYQVDTLKDVLLELEEQLAESQRQYEEKSKELEREKHAHSVLQFQFAEVKEALRQREDMLEEIRQLQQKQASYIREISDLQETIEWKDKKIGALERQKEFFDSIRSERDDLREEVVKLKEELKKHGIILNSEIATNGETSDTLNNIGHQGPSKMTEEELNALKSAGAGTLGRATEVEVKNEIVENMGKREILQNTEQEQHKEDTVKDYVSHPGEHAEQKTSGDSAPSPGPRADANCEEQVHSQVLENTAFLKSPGQVESREVLDMPDGKTGASPEQPSCLRDLDNKAPVPISGQDSCAALGTKSQSEQPVGRQEKENPEDWRSDSEEVSPKPCQEFAPVPTPEAERMSRTEAGEPHGDHLGSVGEAGGATAAEHVGTVAASPQKRGDDPVSHGGQCVLGTVFPSTGQSLEKELTSQEVAEPREAPIQSTDVGGKNSAEEGGGAEARDEKPGPVEPQLIPGTPNKSSHQEATGSGGADAENELLDAKEPEEEKDQQAETSESSQKRSKNKKKKNKKKRSPASAEALEGVKKELTYQEAEVGEVKEEKQVQFADKKQVAETQNEVTKNPEQKIIAGSKEHVDCPASPETELDGKLNQEDNDVKTMAGRTSPGGMASCDGDPVESPDASDKELDGGVTRDNAKADSVAQNSPLEPENEDGSSSSPLRNNSPARDTASASQAGSAKRQFPSDHPGQAASKAEDGLSLEGSALSAAGETGGSNSEGGGEAEVSQRGKSKEDCTMS
ncbi:leucine-rich repeat flightless-interacting protein 1 isoform X6 [Sciurus carolinensis]|uniref:leucine-rich repeat flightless-interacting protein 1 isoform X6 n=1 Tax=Sciurus carolinensis TaxID=30640 RepID=UPI001FB306A7|nr:leucine-rich repeat flightless-interacting protein 1 isoform X6 [Sciurus carolinensis]